MLSYQELTNCNLLVTGELPTRYLPINLPMIC